jgi:ATP-dependent RNA circularization protein (DNA/RNA ligase family)
MFRKYSKTYRIPVPQFNIKGKLFLSGSDVQLLLAGKVVIEEKIDGANTGIIRHKKGFSLQKKGSLVGQSEHEQFNFFHHWANVLNYDRIIEVPPGHIIYGELCYAVHHIYYDSLPDYFLVFDVYKFKGGKWLNRNERNDFCKCFEFYQVPLITEGYFDKKELVDLIPKKSNFGPQAEGIVVKRYRKKEYLRAKLVRPEFVKELNEDGEHWTKKELKVNKLAKN